FLPARSLAQPRDSTRVVPAVPCCRSQPHCSSGSRGRDGKTAWALAAGCRWTPEASGRAAQRRARATGAWAKPSSTDCGPLSHLRHNAACELVSPDNSLRTYVGAASRPPPC
ncbi:unnamed protein product, partial [Prorocentrum cordatum]